MLHRHCFSCCALLMVVVTVSTSTSQPILYPTDGPAAPAITCIASVGNGRAVVGIERGGLFLFDLAQRRFLPVVTPGGPGSTPLAMATVALRMWIVGTEAGLFYSRDSASTWQLAEGLPANQKVTGLYAAATGVLLAKTAEGAFLSADSGKSWGRVSAIPPRRVQAVFADASLLLVQVEPRISGEPLLYRSLDNGASWQPVAGFPESHVRGFVRAAGERVVAVAASGILVSTDNGSSWQWRISLPAGNTFQSLDIVGTTQVYALPSPSNRVYRSLDAGSTWNTIGSYLPAANGTVIQCLSPDTLLLGTDVGLYLSTSGGKQWEPVTAGLPPTSLHGVAVLANGTILAVGSGNGVHRSIDRGTTWHPLNHAFQSFPRHPSLMHPLRNGSIFLALDQPGTLFVSRDYGTSWQHVDSLQDVAITAMAEAPNGDVYAGAIGTEQVPRLLRSVDGGKSWFPLELHTAEHDTIRALLALPGGRLWVGTAQGLLFRSVDNGITWESLNIDTGGQFQDAKVGAVLALAENSKGSVLAGGNGLWQSSDSGRSWQEALPPSETGLVHKVLSLDNGRLFLAADSGVFASEDAGLTFYRMLMVGRQTTLPARDLAIDAAGDLYVATPQGVWRATNVTGLPKSEIHVDTSHRPILTIYPNPFNPATTVEYELIRPGHVVIIVYDMLGRTVRTLVDGWRSAGRYRLRWFGEDDRGRPLPSGIYWIKLSASENARSARVVLVR